MEITRRALLGGAALAAVGCAAARPGAAPDGPARADPYRLPHTVVPRRYVLRIEPDLARARFTGAASIDLEVREPVSEVVLNATALEVGRVGVDGASGPSWPGTVVADEAAERVRLRFPEILSPGRWRLSLAFAGILNDRLQGFFRSVARRPDGSETTLALTQLQAADARRVFPCWDEPAFKAVFEVTLVVDERLIALSNAAVAATDPMPGTGKKAVRFAPTIPMSTYLVAFIVGDLEATEPAMVNGVALRVWALRGRGHLGGFGREAGAFALRFLGDYYGTPYPGDKLDLVAVPDFEAGGMENLGAVFLRETNLLVDEGRAAPAELRSIADNVAHEIAHQWFGDLVTMAWWNGLWLNEAFATFMQMLTVDAWRPAWDRWGIFAVARGAALESDALRSTRPVEFGVRTPAEAEAMFDALTYQKGAAILRMIERHLGAEVFRRGVRAYLARHRLANAETGDLWTALGEASGLPVGGIMDAWVSRPGYPMVTVRAEDGGRVLVLSGRRFAYDADGRVASTWRIPVLLRAGGAGGIARRRVLLGDGETRVDLPAPADWVMVNEEGAGYYRARYESGLLARLADDLLGRLSAVERFGLLNDAWATALAGLLPLEEYLDLTGRIERETDRNVWASVIESFAYLERVVAPPEQAALAALVRARLGPVAARLGVTVAPGEDPGHRELRADLLRALGTLGDDAETQATARALHLRSLADPGAVDPSLVPALIAVRAHAGGEADWEEFLARFKQAATPQEGWRYLFSLSRFRAPGLVARTLAMTLEGQVRSQDSPYLVRNLLLSVAGREQAWRFVREHWEALARRYTRSGLATVCEGVTGLATPALEREVREFFASRAGVLGGKTLDQYLERLAIAVAFGGREAPALARYLGRSRAGERGGAPGSPGARGPVTGRREAGRGGATAPPDGQWTRESGSAPAAMRSARARTSSIPPTK